MGVFPLAVAKPWRCHVAFGRLKMRADGLVGTALRVWEAAIRRDGDKMGAAGPALREKGIIIGGQTWLDVC